ncbi:MAG: NUDIX hydrolase [Armatimonadota bacterium]
MSAPRYVDVEVSHRFLLEVQQKIKESGSPGEVVLVVPRPGGGILLHTKSFYPPETYRLPTGKLLPEEDSLDAFHREFTEELGTEGRVDCSLGVVVHRLKSGNEEPVEFVSHVYLAHEMTEEPVPQDDGEQITGFIEVSASELTSVADRLENLPGHWLDWGRFRAIAHRFVAESLL